MKIKIEGSLTQSKKYTDDTVQKSQNDIQVLVVDCNKTTQKTKTELEEQFGKISDRLAKCDENIENNNKRINEIDEVKIQDITEIKELIKKKEKSLHQ